MCHGSHQRIVDICSLSLPGTRSEGTAAVQHQPCPLADFSLGMHHQKTVTGLMMRKTCLDAMPQGKPVLPHVTKREVEVPPGGRGRTVFVLVLVVEYGRGIYSDGYVTLWMDRLLDAQTIQFALPPPQFLLELSPGALTSKTVAIRAVARTRELTASSARCLKSAFWTSWRPSGPALTGYWLASMGRSEEQGRPT